MARIHSIGFESNSLTTNLEITVASGSPTIQSSVKRSGNYALQINSLSSGTKKSVNYNWVNSNSDGPFFFRQCFRVDTLPSAENTFIILQSSSPTTSVYMTIDNAGAIKIYDEDGQITGSTTLSTSTWYRIEIKFDRSPAGGSEIVSARVDGVDFATGTTRSLATAINTIVWGGNLQSEAQTTGNWYFDDLAINDSTGSFQNSYPGAGSIIHLHPDAAGDNNQLGGAASTNYQNVDEATPDDVTTTITTVANSVGDIDDYNVEASGITADSINVVAVGTRFAGGGASANDSFVLRIKASSGGTVQESSDLTPANTSYVTNTNATQKNYALTLYDLPGASTTVWTVSDLDQAQIGFKKSADSTNGAILSTIWMLVDYVPSTSNINTRNKRASILNYDRTSRVFPNPDGTLDAADRLQMGYKYSGIAAQNPTPAVSSFNPLFLILWAEDD